MSSASPESAHQVLILMSDRGIPRTFRHMHGFGSHTFSWMNAGGEKFWVKYHFHTNQGMAFFSNAEAAAMAGADADYHRRDLFNAIAAGRHPSWRLSVQVMPYTEAKAYRFNPFDLTKTWPHADYPLLPVGTMTLNRRLFGHRYLMDRIVPGGTSVDLLADGPAIIEAELETLLAEF